MKQQSYLDEMREITDFWTYFKENHTVEIGNKYQIYYIVMLPKSDCNMPGDAGIFVSIKYFTTIQSLAIICVVDYCNKL